MRESTGESARTHMRVGDLNNISKNLNKGKQSNDSSTVQCFEYERGKWFWETKEDKALKQGLVKYKHILYVKSRGVKGIWSKIKADDTAKSVREWAVFEA